MFGRIARRYDAANRLCSFGVDRGWRRRLVAAAVAAHPARVLDLATGSGDVAFSLARALPGDVAVVGMDFCLPMLEEAEKKRETEGCGRKPGLTFEPGDALNLPAPDGAFGAITIAFGFRNLADRARALREMRRVLKPGGVLLILEFSQPNRGLRGVYGFYLRRILPRIGGWVTGDRSAYEYLCTSIEGFPNRQALAKELVQAGFREVTATPMTGGIVALHRGVA